MSTKTKRNPVYTVVVGNVGTICETISERMAWRDYGQYAAMSLASYGRVSGESVTLLRDGEIMAEMVGQYDIDGTDISPELRKAYREARGGVRCNY